MSMERCWQSVDEQVRGSDLHSRDGVITEVMMKKKELDEEFFEDGVVVPVVTIFSYDTAPPATRGLR